MNQLNENPGATTNIPINLPQYEKSFTFPQDFTSFDIAQAIADFRRGFNYLEGIIVKIPVEKEYRLRGLTYDFFGMKVGIEIGLQEPNVVIIQSTQ